jgi:hypothetical protein
MATWEELQEIGSRWREDSTIWRVFAVDDDPDTGTVVVSRSEGFGTVRTCRPAHERSFLHWVRVPEFEPGDIVTWGDTAEYEVRFVDVDGVILVRGRWLAAAVVPSELRLVRKADR